MFMIADMCHYHAADCVQKWWLHSSCFLFFFFFFFIILGTEPPRITTHPQELKDAVPGKPAMFIIQATGTEPLYYQWQHKTGGKNREWQSCNVERFPGANSSTLTIPSVQKSDEGSYRCVITNVVGSETSECATLTVGVCNCYIIKLTNKRYCNDNFSSLQLSQYKDSEQVPTISLYFNDILIQSPHVLHIQVV